MHVYERRTDHNTEAFRPTLHEQCLGLVRYRPTLLINRKRCEMEPTVYSLTICECKNKARTFSLVGVNCEELSTARSRINLLEVAIQSIYDPLTHHHNRMQLARSPLWYDLTEFKFSLQRSALEWVVTKRKVYLNN